MNTNPLRLFCDTALAARIERVELLAARLVDAATTGSDVAVVTTQPGSRS
jgi:hypothetical protein